MTSLMENAASNVAAPETEILATTSRAGFPYISSRVEAELSAVHILETIAEHHNDVDAVIISGFGDPGLDGARQLFDLPVVGVSEAAILTACALGDRFSIVTFTDRFGPLYNDCVLRAGLAQRFAGFCFPRVAFPSIDTVQQDLAGSLVELVEEAVRTERADVVILAGGPLAGLARKVAHRVPIPLIDPVENAVVFAEGLVRQRLGKAMSGSTARPPAKVSVGLPDRLAKRLEHMD